MSSMNASPVAPLRQAILRAAKVEAVAVASATVTGGLAIACDTYFGPLGPDGSPRLSFAQAGPLAAAGGFLVGLGPAVAAARQPANAGPEFVPWDFVAFPLSATASSLFAGGLGALLGASPDKLLMMSPLGCMAAFTLLTDFPCPWVFCSIAASDSRSNPDSSLPRRGSVRGPQERRARLTDAPNRGYGALGAPERGSHAKIAELAAKAEAHGLAAAPDEMAELPGPQGRFHAAQRAVKSAFGPEAAAIAWSVGLASLGYGALRLCHVRNSASYPALARTAALTGATFSAPWAVTRAWYAWRGIATGNGYLPAMLGIHTFFSPCRFAVSAVAIGVELNETILFSSYMGLAVVLGAALGTALLTCGCDDALEDVTGAATPTGRALEVGGAVDVEPPRGAADALV